jgi:hypothetical protein
MIEDRYNGQPPEENPNPSQSHQDGAESELNQSRSGLGSPLLKQYRRFQKLCRLSEEGKLDPLKELELRVLAETFEPGPRPTAEPEPKPKPWLR